MHTLGIHLQGVCTLVFDDLERIKKVPKMDNLDTIVQGQCQSRPHAGIHALILGVVEKRHEIQKFRIQIVGQWQNIVRLVEEGI